MRVIIAEDNFFYRRGLAEYLTDFGVDVVGEAENGDQAVELATSKMPDVAILDIAMPVSVRDAGLVAAELLRTTVPDVGIFVLSEYCETQYAIRLLEPDPRGKGYWLKSNVTRVDQLPAALNRIAEGDSVVDPEIIAHLTNPRRNSPARNILQNLTPTELAVLKMVAAGWKNQYIATTMGTSRSTVDNQVDKLLTKMGFPADNLRDRRVVGVLKYLQAVVHSDSK